MINLYSSEFRDELIVTGLVLVLAASSSYFFLDQVLFEQKEAGISEESVKGILDTLEQANVENDQNIGLNPENQALISETTLESPSPTPSPSPSPSPTPIENVVEIPLGSGKNFENEYYKANFSAPRLVSGNSTVFKVDVVLANISIGDEGFINRLHATIIKDGEVLISEAAMNNTELKTVKVGEQITFTASMSLVPGTDVSEVRFAPGDEYPVVSFDVGAI